jgi:hypothetical protein
VLCELKESSPQKPPIRIFNDYTPPGVSEMEGVAPKIRVRNDAGQSLASHTLQTACAMYYTIQFIQTYPGAMKSHGGVGVAE